VAAAVTAYQQAVAERLRQAELAHAAEAARAEEAQATAAQERQARQAAQARAAAERRARRLTLGLAASVLLSVLLGGGGWLWLAQQQVARERAALSQRAKTTREVQDALTQAQSLREQARGSRAAAGWTEARAMAKRAEALAESGPVEPELAAQVQTLLRELSEEEKDQQLLAALDAAHLAQAETIVEDNRFAAERAVPLYREALRAYGLPAGELAVEEAAARIKERPAVVREALVAILDYWISLAEDPKLKVAEPHLSWLRGVVTAADPEAWGKDYRVALAEKDKAQRRAALGQLAERVNLRQFPARALTRLARQLLNEGDGAGAVGLLQRAQQRYPGDFWVNQYLGVTLLEHQKPADPAEAIRYLTVAVALRPDSPGTHYNLGNALRQQGKLDEAIAAYHRAIDIDPRSAPAHANLGLALQRQGKLDDAITAYRQAIALDPKHAPTHNSLGNALAQQGKLDDAIAAYRHALDLGDGLAYINLGNALLGKRNPDEAIAAYRAALAIDPNDAGAYYNLGKALQAQGKPDDAITAYRDAIRLQPEYAEAHCNLGLVLQRQGKYAEALAELRTGHALGSKQPGWRYPSALWVQHGLGNALQAQGKLDDAITAYRQALDLDPKYTQAHISLGNALLQQRQLDDAIAAYRQALDIDPKYAPVHNNLGLALQRQGKLDDAITAYRRSLDIDPKYALAHYNLGNALYKQGQRDAAIREYRAALALDPKSALAHHGLGNALMDKGHLDEAIREYREALRLDPKDANAHTNLGIALSKKGEPDEAIGEFRAALAINPNDAKTHSNLGSALADKGRLEEAILEYHEAFRLDPKDAKAHYNLGSVLAEQRQWDAAIQEYRAALALDPTYAWAQYNLGNALQAQGKLDDAITAYREAIRLKPDHAEAHCNLGHVLRQQGKYAEALVELRTGHALGSKQPGWRYPSALWVQEVELEPRLPAILQGEDKPADNAERLTLARLCLSRKKLCVAAVRFYEEAFADDPKLAGDLRQAHRYNAACAAALAGWGQGKDADQLDMKERGRLRQRARDWLQADLALWAKQAASADPKARAVVQRQLKHWQTDADLAGIRDKDAVAKLPAEEQEACRKLWAEVEALLQKAREHAPP
jgi:tetratricopeptide (TPR) repeat protein